ncbi:MAG TPA: tetratricopeptide repeat protein [Acidobacteriota bacterium]|nr:tetratricopeptide repeat protein [Acidobacteriota bacterium]
MRNRGRRHCASTCLRAAPFALALISTMALSVPGSGQDEVDVRLQRGIQLLSAARVEEAITELEAAALLEPRNWQARYHLGRALYAGGRAEEAVAHLIAALEQTPEPGRVNSLLAQVWLQLEEWEAAAEALDATELAMPGFPPAAFYRGELCYRLGRLEVARRHVERAAEAAPDWDRPLLSAAVLAEEDEDPEAAVRWLRAAVELQPDDAMLRVRLGSALAAAQQPRESVAAFRRALEIAPDLEAARMRLLLQLDGLGDRGALVREIDTILAREPDNGAVRSQRARLLNREGHTQDALAEIDEAIVRLAEATPSPGQSRGTVERNARGFRARLLMQLGRNADAAAEARALVQKHPSYPEPFFVLGTVLMRQGDSEGRSLLERFKALSDAREHRRTAGGLMLRGDLERAGVEYRAALRRTPGEPRASLGLAIVLRRQGDHAGALALLMPPTGDVSLLAEWYRELVLALYNDGQLNEARQLWEQLRGRRFVLGVEVWRVMRPAVAACS